MVLKKLLKLASRRPPALLLRLLKLAPIVPFVMLTALVVFLVIYLRRHGIALLEPHGVVADKERNLMLFALSLSLLVVIPVFIMLFLFAWKYREGNVAATYSPDLAGNRKAETVWWLIPTLLITVLSVVTWNSSHDLDPFKPLASTVKPLQVQVVSLDWKWLFIYPEQGVASVNELHIPVNTPVDFTLTSDAPMNSFWIPQLGGQIYTMPGMSTQLHLMADKAGNYRGQSANISGVGFAGMKFMTQATANDDFNQWVDEARQSKVSLDQSMYDKLAQPSQNTRPAVYSAVLTGLYDTVLTKYVGAGGMADMHMHGMEGM